MPAITTIKDVADDVGATWNILSNQRKIDMVDEIALLEPDMAPFLTMLMNPDLPTLPAKSQKIEWLTDEYVPRIASAALGSTVGSDTATSIVVAAGYGGYFRTNDLVRNEATGEIFLVTAVATDTLTVQRGIGSGGTGTLFVAVSDVLVKVSNASKEGATRGDIRMTVVVANYNYTQIQRDPFGFTLTLEATETWGGNVAAREGKKKQLEHKRQIEHTLFVGKRDLKTPASQHPQSMCGGLLGYISSNVTTVGGNLTAANLETYLRTHMRYGSRRKVAFCSPMFFSALAFFNQQKLALGTFAEASKQVGVSVTRYITGAGQELDLVLKLDWQDFPTASPGMGGTAVIVDLPALKFRPLRPTALMPRIQGNDEDSTIQEYKTEFSLHIGDERRHGIIRGVTGYA